MSRRFVTPDYVTVDLEEGVSPEQLAAEKQAARAALARLHQPVEQPDGTPSECGWCGLPFPCPDSAEAHSAPEERAS